MSKSAATASVNVSPTVDDDAATDLVVPGVAMPKFEKSTSPAAPGLIVEDARAMKLLGVALDLIEDDIASGRAQLSDPVSGDQFVADFYGRLGKGFATVIARRRQRRNKPTSALV